jgi:sugar lactone lactonase YvrE
LPRRTGTVVPTPTPSATPTLAPNSVSATLNPIAATTITVAPLNGITGTMTFAAPSAVPTGAVLTMTITTSSNLGGTSPYAMQHRDAAGGIFPLNFYGFVYTCTINNYAAGAACPPVPFPPALLLTGFTSAEVPAGDNLYAAAYGPASTTTPFLTEQLALSGAAASGTPPIDQRISMTSGDFYGFSLYAEPGAATPTPTPTTSPTPLPSSASSATPSPVPTGATTGAGIDDPIGLAVNASNDLFVANNITNEVLAFTSSGVPIPGDDVAANLNYPSAITVDPSGNLWVVNIGDSTITEYNIATDAEDSYDTLNSSNGIGVPTGIAVDANGYIFVSQGYPSAGVAIFKLTTPGSPPTPVATIATDASGNALNPSCMTLATVDGQEFILLGNSTATPNNIRAYSAAQMIAGINPTVEYTLTTGISGPVAIAVSPTNSAVYVANYIANSVTIYTQSGAGVAQSGTISGPINQPHGLAVNSSGDVYVSNDGTLNDVVEFGPNGGSPIYTISGRHRVTR